MQKNESKYKIVLTGGHAATTALAVIQELRSRREGYDLYWIGAHKPIEGQRVAGIEHSVFPKLEVTIHTIVAGRIQRKFSVHTLPSLARIPLGFFNAFSLVSKIRPDIILSFGGYAAFPVVVIGWLFRIPVILHEQTVAVGLANKMSAFFVKKVALAREESKPFFPGNKTVLVGNPLIEQITKIAVKTKISSPPVVYITGGSRGSLIVNSAIDEILEKLLSEYLVYHHTGELDYEKFAHRQKNLPEKLRHRYHVFSTIDPLEVYKYYQKADIVVARAGANTVSEIIYVGRPAILIPIPWTRFDEQTKNALMAKKFGVATVLSQDKLSGAKLLQEISIVYKNWNTITTNMNRQTASLDESAAGKLVNLMTPYLNEKKT